MTEEEGTEPNNSGISRRRFIQGTTTGVALVAGGALLGGAPFRANAPATSVGHAEGTASAAGAQAAGYYPAPVPTSWSQTADVVIVGTGLAGLSAAITAHDAGADVLVLEKLDQAHEGGNSRVAGQWLCAAMDLTKSPPAPMAAEGAAYWQAMSCGTVDDPNIAMARSQGYIDNLAMVKALGGNLGTISPGASHPGPGSQYIVAFVIAPDGAPVQATGYPQGSTGDSRLWNVFRNAVTSRNISVMYETPATDLIQSPATGEILGVRALSNYSEVLDIRANRAVILACGSIEHAPDLQKQYFPFWPVYPMSGTPGNTGDGIRMAQNVGAALWHMNALYSSGYNTFVIPGTDPASAAHGGVTGVAYVSAPGIRVNKYGNRFNMGNAVNGALGGFGGETNVSEVFDMLTLDWDSVPCWAIFDDTGRKSRCIDAAPQVPSNTPNVGGIMGWFNTFSGYTWSADNSAEVASGWILSANSLSDLASAIAADPDDLGKMTGSQLQVTVEAYNEGCANNADRQFFTPTSGLTPMNGPPFYAMKLWPTFDHGAFGGGPKRNIQCQVLNPYDNPIPRLYEAGELGGFYYLLCTGGEHLSDSVFSGRVAGNNAAAEVP